MCRPHAEIGREGPVCPFVPKLVESGELRVEIDDSLDGTDALAMEARVRAAVPVLEAIPLAPWKKALVVVFPNVTGPNVTVVDEVQAAMKPDSTRRELWYQLYQ